MQGGSPEYKQATSLVTESTGGLWSKSSATGSRIPGRQEEKRTLSRQTMYVSTWPGDSVHADLQTEGCV